MPSEFPLPFESSSQPDSVAEQERAIIETPEQAELALEAAFANYFDPQQQIAQFWQRRENWPPAPYRFDDPNNSMAREQYIEHVDTIDQPNMATRWALARSIPILNAAAREDQLKWEAVRYAQLVRARIATQSSSKQALLRPLIEAEGLEVKFASAQDWSDEEQYQKLFKSFKSAASGQAQMLAGTKIRGEATDLLLGLDTSVVMDAQLIHKPVSVDAAREALRSMSGQRLVVEDGFTMSLRSFKGERFSFADSLAIEMQLREYNDQDIADYLQAMGERVLSIAGGIDYASAAGQQLVSDEPIRLYMMGAEDASKGELNQVNRDEAIQLLRSAMPALRDYFRGVPKAPLKRIIQGSKVIYSEL